MDQNGTTSQEGDERGREFSAILTPHRSLSPRGFLVFMVIFGLISFIAGLAFFFMGATRFLRKKSQTAAGPRFACNACLSAEANSYRSPSERKEPSTSRLP